MDPVQVSFDVPLRGGYGTQAGDLLKSKAVRAELSLGQNPERPTRPHSIAAIDKVP